jgi:hypothetical protein
VEIIDAKLLYKLIFENRIEHYLNSKKIFLFVNPDYLKVMENQGIFVGYPKPDFNFESLGEYVELPDDRHMVINPDRNCKEVEYIWIGVIKTNLINDYFLFDSSYISLDLRREIDDNFRESLEVILTKLKEKEPELFIKIVKELKLK